MAAPLPLELDVKFSVQEIPRLSIQWDWKDAFRNGEKVWVACSSLGQPSVYGHVRQYSDISSDVEVNPIVEASDGFVVNTIDKRSITVTDPNRTCTTKFITPSSVFSTIHKKRIRFIDVSPGGGLCVSSDDNEILRVWNTTDGSVRHDLTGHISDVNCCRFFPSGEVIASCGADLQVKLWSAIDGSCPVTLKGHTRGVTDIVIVERGRNIVSCSRDGTARLWDCGESRCLAVLYRCDCPINACSLASFKDVDTAAVDDVRSEREVGTEGKLLLLAGEDGVLAGVGLHSRKKVFEFKSPSAFNCCTFLTDVDVCGGTDDGKIWFLDIRNASSPVGVFQRSKSPILSVLPFGCGSLLASTGDGCCFHWNFSNSSTDGLVTNWELTGPDCDPVYRVCTHGNTVYTVCRDALVRKYVLNTTELC